MPRPISVAALAFVALLTVEVAADDVERAWIAVPSESRRHGEVRVVERGGATVVQTVLSSRVLRQVARRIAGKEQRNWPAGVDGHDDAERYIASLVDALDLLPPVPDGASGEDRRRALVIEFVLGPEDARVKFGDPEVTVDPSGRLVLGAIRPVLELDPSRAYVERNQRLIVEDAFGLGEREAATLLASAPAP